MIVKKMKLRGQTECACCMRTIKKGQSAIVAMDYDEIPYNDKYFCNQRCYHGEIFVDTKFLLAEEGNA